MREKWVDDWVRSRASLRVMLLHEALSRVLYGLCKVLLLQFWELRPFVFSSPRDLGLLVTDTVLKCSLKAKGSFASDCEQDLRHLISCGRLGMSSVGCVSLHCHRWVLNLLAILLCHDVHGLDQLLLPIKLKCLVSPKCSLLKMCIFHFRVMQISLSVTLGKVKGKEKVRYLLFLASLAAIKFKAISVKGCNWHQKNTTPLLLFLEWESTNSRSDWGTFCLPSAPLRRLRLLPSPAGALAVTRITVIFPQCPFKGRVCQCVGHLPLQLWRCRCHWPPCSIFCSLPFLPHCSNPPPPLWCLNGFMTSRRQISLTGQHLTSSSMTSKLWLHPVTLHIPLLLFLAKTCWFSSWLYTCLPLVLM